MDYFSYWDDVIRQQAERLPRWFAEDAEIQWPCTNERFTAGSFIRASCAYPGAWNGRVEKLAAIPGGAVTVVRVWSETENRAFHVTSFFEVADGKIASLTEYWADDGSAPAWRQEMRLSRPCDAARK